MVYKMKEKDIKLELKHFWVGFDGEHNTVFKYGVTCSESYQSFTGDSDGLSLALAYCKYIDKRFKEK